MSNSIAERFQALKKEHRCALIPFITAGDPDLETTKAAIAILDRNGADFIELGVPYSDPLADGPVIQAAATRALQRGTRLEDVLDLVKNIAPQTRSPIILFTYYNPILSRGIAAFFQQIAAAGVKGLVIPDLPMDEANEVLEIAQAAGIEVILLIAPTSSPNRIAAIAQKSQGFIYLVSVTGVTGTRTEVSSRVEGLIQQIRQITDKAIGIGFGISDAEQARQVRDWNADAVIVGSAFVKRLAQPEGLKAIEQLCCELRSAISPQPATVG